MPKQKTPQDIFETQCWTKEIITDPHQVLAQLFDRSGVHDLRRFIHKTMQAALSTKLYKAISPASVLETMRSIYSLLLAAHQLKATKSSAIVVNEADILNPQYFVCNRHQANAWTDFPRQLSLQEYANPYIVFRKFFKLASLQEWLQLWTDIIETALCREDMLFPQNEIKVYTQLVKLVEAAHLIDVREVVHVGGFLKARS